MNKGNREAERERRGGKGSQREREIQTNRERRQNSEKRHVSQTKLVLRVTATQISFRANKGPERSELQISLLGTAVGMSL